MGVLVSRASPKAWSVRREGIGKGGRHGACQDICEIFAFHMEKFMTDPVTILPRSVDRPECHSSNLGKGED